MDWEQAKGPLMLMGEIILLPCSRTAKKVEEKVVVRHSYSSSKDVGDSNTMEEAPFLCRPGVKDGGVSSAIGASQCSRLPLLHRISPTFLLEINFSDLTKSHTESQKYWILRINAALNAQ
jgi:hypothetical protein